MTRCRALLLLTLGAFAPASNAHAQDVAPHGRTLLTASAIAGMVDHRADIGTGVERTSGPVFGIQLDAWRSPALMLSVHGAGGTLDSRSPLAGQRDIGEVGADARMRVLSWLDARAGATVRSFTSELARQRWTQLSVGADSRIAMLGGRIDGTAGAALLPFVRVSGHEAPRLAFAASMGLHHSSRRFDLGLLYQLERYDFAETAGASRKEEHSVLLLRAGYRMSVGRFAR
jgi:hypothetical protein